MKRLIPIALCAVLLLSGIPLAAQNRLVVKGDEAFGQKNFAAAAGYYVKALESGDIYHDAYLVNKKAGDSYYALRQYDLAADYYEKYFGAGSKPDSVVLYKYAKLLLNRGNPEEAKKMFSGMLRRNPGNRDLEVLMACCDFAFGQLSGSSTQKADNLKKVNSLQSDFGPAFREGDLIFASRRLNEDYTVIADRDIQGYSDYYIAKYNKKKQTFRKPVRLKGNINGDFDDGSFTYCRQTQTAWVTKCDGSPGTCAIYSAMIKKHRWTNLRPVQIGESKYNYSNPSVSPDGGTMYFTSDMPGGFGGKDIWRATLTPAGQIVDPVNAGALVNTVKDEIYPFIMGDSVLFFASEGHVGMGGFDIFYSRKTGDRFEKPVNPGVPVNSTADDFSLVAVPGRQTWYFCSNRNQERSDDIFYTSGVITGKRAAPEPEESGAIPQIAVKEPDKVPEVPEQQALRAAEMKAAKEPGPDILNEPEQTVNPILTPQKYYRVQISAGSRLVDPSGQFRGISDLTRQYGLSVDKVGGLYKYRVGNFETRKEAQVLQSELKRRGYRDCFIVEF